MLTASGLSRRLVDLEREMSEGVDGSVLSESLIEVFASKSSDEEGILRLSMVIYLLMMANVRRKTG